MRLAGKEKGGFYPLPPVMTDYIQSNIQTQGDNLKLLDPCCGKGEAMQALALGLNMIPYGCELHEIRYDWARRGLRDLNNDRMPKTNVINDDMINISTPDKSFSVLYLNPPYDWHKESGREEYRWLKKLRRVLMPGGLLVWIIPEVVLRDKNVIRYLATWFDQMSLYRFVGETYEDFDQVVLYGILRPKAVPANPAVMRSIRQLSKLGEDLPEHPMFEQPSYQLSNDQAPAKFWFYGLKPDREVLEAEVDTYGVRQHSDFKAFMSPTSREKLEPVIPMKVGHIAATIAAGHVNNQKIVTDNGPVLIKGSIYIEPIAYDTQEVIGDRVKDKTTIINDPRSVIATINESGAVTYLKNEVLGTFLRGNLAKLAKKLQQLYPPKYNFKLGKYRDLLEGVNPRMVPNTKIKGLLPAQGHTTAGIICQWDYAPECILVGQLGTGKTVMSIAAAYAMHRKNSVNTHFTVMCPPHLVEKWIREIRLTWPAAKAMRLISPTSIDRFMRDDGPIFGVMKSTTASLGAGWSHAFYLNGPVELAKVDKLTKPVEFLNAPDKVMDAYNATAEDDDFWKHQAYLRRHPITCPNCNAPILVADKKNKGSFMPASLSDFKIKKMNCPKCKGALWQDTKKGKGRYPLTTYIARRYKHNIDIAIIDEAHQYKGESSDRGIAYARMCAASKYQLAMTGTIYGGKASTLFFLLFRLSPEFRRSWVDPSKKKHHRMMYKAWKETYGVIEETYTSSHESSSTSTGNRRPTKQTKEIAGSSPAMLPWLLNRTVFVSLGDMGQALPNYKEIGVEVEMDEEMDEQYSILYSNLSVALGERVARGDKSLLSAYLYALIYWPDSPWRPKVVEDPSNPDEIIAAVPGTGQPLGVAPKEAAILKLIQDELKDNRRCLLMCEQTDTLDIQPQWQDFLSSKGITSAILREDASGREAWIKRQEANGTQVLISHPRKVETGLDILGFPTIIWMSPNYSVYTVMQASGRAYRLGQTEDCKVYFFSYKDTLQYQAMKLIIAKMAAAKRVNGDTIESEDLADLDKLSSQSIENALAKILQGGVKEQTRMVEINLDYEQAKEGIFTGHFADCADKDAAKKLYRNLAKANHPDTAEEPEKVQSLSDMFDIANEEFTDESAFIGGSSIRDDEGYYEPEPEPEPEVKEEPAEPEELNVKWTKARIVHTPQGVVAEKIEEVEYTQPEKEPVVVIETPAESPEEPVKVKEEPVVHGTVVQAEENKAAKESERLVFGDVSIEVKRRKRKVVDNKAQLSLF